MQDRRADQLCDQAGDPVQPWVRHQVQAAVQDRLQVQTSVQGKCKLQYKTVYRKFCTTVQDNECRVTVASGSKTVYEQQCSTSYQQV